VVNAVANAKDLFWKGMEVAAAVHDLYDPTGATAREKALPQSVPEHQAEQIGEAAAKRPEQARKDLLRKPEPHTPTTQPIRPDNSPPQHDGRYTPPQPKRQPREPNYGTHSPNREGRRAAEQEARRAPQRRTNSPHQQRAGAGAGELRYRSAPPGREPLTGTTRSPAPESRNTPSRQYSNQASQQPKSHSIQQPRQNAQSSSQPKQQGTSPPRQYSNSADPPAKEAPRRSK
jgi:hypothetical protein